jgi:hypothetical protein
MSYKIFIDGEVYEESSNFDEAKHLYETVDETCLAHYYGHEKKLVGDDGNEIAKDAINDPRAFSDEQISLIRDTFAEILSYPEGKRFVLEGEEDALGIINTCQRIDRNTTFESVEQFRNNKSAHWTEEG